MNDNAEHNTGDPRFQTRGSAIAGDARDARSDPPWLLSHKVELPDVVDAYVERPHLEDRCTATDRRLTLLQAPGGFGKTALLTQCCLRLREIGATVAWLAVDEQDGPVELASYLELAFERAGVKTLDSAENAQSSYAPGVDTDTRAEYRINLLIRSIAQHDNAQCVLALDEVERLRDPDAVLVLNTLLRCAPQKLRFAMAFRERPPELDIAMFTLEGRSEWVTAEDLRFSAPDIARFFETRLSRRELSWVAENSEGWPIALRLYRNAQEAGAVPAVVDADDDTVAAWIETRLWRGLAVDDRDLVLDISLFDWIDPSLIDEATGSSQSGLRIDAMTSLKGLLQTTGGDNSKMRLHSLIREYCARRLFRDNPKRFRTIHAEIAKALARRGHVIEAMRHGAEAGDALLVGKIADGEGGIKMWIRRGLEAVKAVDGWLTAESIATYPRLALLRCVVLATSGDMEGARRVYQNAAFDTAGFTRTAGGEEDESLQLEHLLVLGMLLVWECCNLSGYEPLITAALRRANAADLDPVIRGVMRYGLCLSLNEMTEFEQAQAWLERARADLGGNTLYLTPHIDFQVGLAAMAQGRTQQAEEVYERACVSARPGNLGDATTLMVGEILTAELAFERSTGAPTHRPPLASLRLLAECGAWLDVYAASISLNSEMALLDSGVESALTVVENALQFARATERWALVRLVSALRVTMLVLGGRFDDADQAWHGDNLPVDVPGCVDLKSQRWREIESVACARLHLLIAREEFDDARELAAELVRLAQERHLIRTLMRSLAMSMRLEYHAGSPDRATGHLDAYLRVFEKTDFARPLAREREIAVPLLKRVIESERNVRLSSTAVRVHGALTTSMAAEEDQSVGGLTGGEFEVLRRLGTHSDKEIAQMVNLSHEGLRYRIRRIFKKLGAKGRHDAVHRARSLGVLPPESLTKR